MHACMPALFPGKCAHLVAVAANIGSAHSWLGQPTIWICMLLSCPFLPRYPGPGPSTPARATNYMDDLTGIGRSNPPTNTGHRAPVPCSLRFASRSSFKSSSSSVSLGPAEATKKASRPDMPKDQPVRTPNAHHPNIQPASCSRRDRHFYRRFFQTDGDENYYYRRSIFCPGGTPASCASPPPARRSPEKDEMGRSLPVARLVRPPTHARLMCSRRTRKIPGPRLDPI